MAASSASSPLASKPLGEAQPWVRELLGSMEEAVCLVDPEGRLIYSNSAARGMLAGLAENAESEQKLWEAFAPAEGMHLKEACQRALAERVPVTLDHKKDGAPLQPTARIIPMDSGLCVSFRFNGSKGERDAPNHEVYRALLDNMEEGFCVLKMVWDEQGHPVDYRFEQINAAFAKHTGLHHATGRTVLELNPAHEAHWFKRYGEVEKSGKPARFVEESQSLGRIFEVSAFPAGPPEHRRVAVRFRDISNQRQTEREVERLSREERLRVAELEALLDILPIGIAIALDRQCQNIRVNPAFAKSLGVSPDQNASLTARDEERPTSFRVVDDDGREIPGEELPMQVAAREGRQVRELELNIVHSDGSTVRLLEYAVPLFDAAGVPRGSVGAFVDITERRREEERQRFLVMLDDAVRPLSRAEEIVAVSARLLGEHLKVDRCAYADIEEDEDTMNITGDYTRGVRSIVGRYTFTAFGMEVLRLMRADLPFVVTDIETHEPPPESREAYHATEIRSVICVPLHKEGRFVAAMAVHMRTPRQWAAEEVSLLVHVANRCWEALERVKVTRGLRESESRFRQIADLMPQVVFLANPDGETFYYNRRWYEFSGMPEGLTGDGSFIPVLHPGDVSTCLERWYHSVRTGEPYEIRYRWREAATGEYRWFLGRAIPWRDETGQIVRWYGACTDIDDLVRADAAAREARAEAERANRAKDQFLAALSHELRTPLTPVLMAAESLCDDPDLPKPIHDTLCMMQRNIAMEARLIDDLLDLTRISHGKLALRMQKGEAHSLVQLALDIVRDDAQAKAIHLALDLQAQHTDLRCDPGRLQQVFWNLLKNAVKFTPPGGEITISSRNDDGQLLVEVRDTGIGMSTETLQRIFLPFEQAGLTNDHRYGGLGLGLSISKAIVDMHGGAISATSDGPAHGATFSVRLPHMPAGEGGEEDAAAPQAAAPSLAAHPAPPLRLLVVEDHEPTLNVLARMLRRDGHEVAVAGSLAEAQATAARQLFDLVISDIGLPDGSGIALMASLRDGYNLRGIALTGYGMEEDMKRAHEAGFDVHLTKPVEFSQLRRALAQFRPVIAG